MLSGMAFGDGPLGGDYSMQAGPHDGIKSLMRGAENLLPPSLSVRILGDHCPQTQDRYWICRPLGLACLNRQTMKHKC